VDHVTGTPQADRNAWTEPGVEDLGGGVHRIPLPLPGDALRAVNIYAIASDDGVCLIDAGMATDGAKEQLTSALASIGYGLGDIRNLFITHIHRDHYTLAMALRTTLRGEIAIGEGEQENLKVILGLGAGQGEHGQVARMRRCGAGELIRALGGPGAMREDSPGAGLPWGEPDRWLADGTVLDLKSRTLTAIATPGHTAGHVVYHDEAGAALFAGDHVLPHITPSIGFQPVVPEAALADYMASLRLMLTLPDTRLLPAHGPVSPSTHARAKELLAHHEDRLARMLETVTTDTTAYAVAQSVPWTRRERAFADLDPMNQVLATGETGAHLEVLALRGQLTRRTAGDGADLYTRPATR
jgi:glyoxylase-like metal-dependent hydrolase (beta-lactamase superfamily II)